MLLDITFFMFCTHKIKFWLVCEVFFRMFYNLLNIFYFILSYFLLQFYVFYIYALFFLLFFDIVSKKV